MPLTSEQIYNELSGEDVKEILMVRFADLLNRQPEFQRHLTLPRVKMSLNIQLEVHGRNPPEFAITDEFTVRMKDEGGAVPLPDLELSAQINANTDDPTGQAPDQIREEHGLPVMEPRRGPMGTIEDVPVVREERIKYAFNVTQDYGPMRSRQGNEGPIVGAEVIGSKNGGGGRAEVSPDFTRVRNPNHLDKYDPLDVNGQK
jgi:hypothetical protein